MSIKNSKEATAFDKPLGALGILAAEVIIPKYSDLILCSKPPMHFGLEAKFIGKKQPNFSVNFLQVKSLRGRHLLLPLDLIYPSISIIILVLIFHEIQEISSSWFNHPFLH